MVAEIMALAAAGGLLEVGASAATGGLVGIAGSLLNRGLGIFERRQKRKELELSYEQEREMFRLQQQADAEEREHEQAIVEYQGSVALRTASLEHDSKLQSGYRWVSAARALVRVVLTYLVTTSYLVAVLYIYRDDPLIQQKGMQELAFSMNLVLTWWFGDRSASRAATATG